MSETILQKSMRLEIERYEKPRDRLAIARTHVSFSGSLQKHPADPEKVVLIPDPYAADMTYYEFSREDIKYIEKLPGITNMQGETVNMTRIWVRRNSIAVRCTPFVVGTTQTIP
jgi:inorganic pyrophosphatase